MDGYSRRSPYASPAAFRRALTDRLRSLAVPNGPWALADLQRQFAYDRLLARLYMMDSNWIVKGSTALLARHIAVRHTIDVDVYRATEQDRAESDLRQAMQMDAGDWFAFAAGPGHAVAGGVSGTRVPVNAQLGSTSWARFHVDLVSDGLVMTGDPDEVPALTEVSLPWLNQPAYRAYPLSDHIADKVCAILERRYPSMRPSTRFKDLVDLAALVQRCSVNAIDQELALKSEARRRNLDLPSRFGVPDRTMWEGGYAAEARRASLPVASTLSEALSIVGPYIDPVLDGTARGVWTPGVGWT